MNRQVTPSSECKDDSISPTCGVLRQVFRHRSVVDVTEQHQSPGRISNSVGLKCFQTSLPSSELQELYDLTSCRGKCVNSELQNRTGQCRCNALLRRNVDFGEHGKCFIVSGNAVHRECNSDLAEMCAICRTRSPQLTALNKSNRSQVPSSCSLATERKSAEALY